jgi:CheY-like chemotaxis protein
LAIKSFNVRREVTMAATEVLAGRKVLLVEDDFFVADEIVRTLAEGGADVVGPAVSVQGALELIDQSAPLDGAVLDVNLNGEKVYPVADALAERGVPFVFATSCSKEMIPRRYAAVTSCGKVVDPRRIAQALFS